VLVGLGASSALWLATRAPQRELAPERGAVLDGVTLLEPGIGRRGPVRLRVVGDRIESIDEAEHDTGRFVLPAFTDMHAHPSPLPLAGDDDRMSLLHLRYGVTRVRLLGMGDVSVAVRTRDRIDAGRIAGPTYWSCGPIIDGADPIIPGARSAVTAGEARALVTELAEAGADCIKAYDRLTPDVMEALRSAAHDASLPIVGHVPQAMDLADADLDDVQHMRGVHPPFEDEDLRYPRFLAAWRRLDEARIRHVVETSKRHGMAHTPTLVAVEGTVVAEHWARWRQGPIMQRWSPHLRDGLWSGEVGFNPARFATEGDRKIVRDALAQIAIVIRALDEAGVPLHTGTDANAPNLVPGASLHREFRLLAGAGLPAETVLRASTTVSPRFLGIQGAGLLRPGSPAELSVFEEDPTQDLAALDSLVAVVADGRLYSTEDLDRRLGRYREHDGSFAYRRVLMPSLRLGLRVLSGVLPSSAD
jgi:hypothetical protein